MLIVATVLAILLLTRGNDDDDDDDDDAELRQMTVIKITSAVAAMAAAEWRASTLYSTRSFTIHRCNRTDEVTTDTSIFCEIFMLELLTTQPRSWMLRYVALLLKMICNYLTRACWLEDTPHCISMCCRLQAPPDVLMVHDLLHVRCFILSFLLCAAAASRRPVLPLPAAIDQLS